MGDAHIAQGDSEFDGTGIETSITGRFRLTLHKKGSLPKTVQVRQKVAVQLRWCLLQGLNGSGIMPNAGLLALSTPTCHAADSAVAATKCC